MIRGIPTPLRLDVKSGNLRQGTSWLLGNKHIVTAFHVVADDPEHPAKWAHEEDPNAQYIAYPPAGPTVLTPVAFDASADVALLTIDSAFDDLQAASTSDWLDDEIKNNTRWTARVIPAALGEEFTISGEVRDVLDNKLRLLIEQGSDESWQGASGSAILHEKGWVIGVLTQEFHGRNTVSAARIEPVERLYRDHGCSTGK